MSKHSKATRHHTLGAPTRGAVVIVERQHDACRADHKPPEPTVCPQCRASFHAGRWQWTAAAVPAHEELCPACRRIHDEFPAGYDLVSAIAAMGDSGVAPYHRLACRPL